MRICVSLLLGALAQLSASETPPTRPFVLPAGISLNKALSPDEAAAIALQNNSTLEVDLSALGIAQADLRDAGLLRNPTIQTLLPVSIKPFEFLLLQPIEDLWQRKKRVLAAQKTLDTLSTGLLQNTLNLIRDVKVAHADLLLAQERANTLEESAALRGRISVFTQRRQDNGDATGIEVSIAQSDARSTEELAVRAIADIKIAQVRLSFLLGIRDRPTPLSAKFNQPSLARLGASDLVQSAYVWRPDLRAAELLIEASAYRAKWQRRRILNLVSPMFSSKESGTGPGLQMDLPFFNRNQGQIARADAEVIQSTRRYTALRDRIELEVRESLARVEQAQISLDRIQTQLKPTVEQAIAQTETAFRNGDASFLNTLESSRPRFDVILRELDAQAALSRAQAELERSVGKKL